MTRVTIKATVRTVREDARGSTIFYERIFLDHDVMKLATIRRWVTIQHGKAMREHPGEAIVGEYSGQMREYPHSFYRGSISGHSGKIMRRDGEMEK